jgi:hypothetical protein
VSHDVGAHGVHHATVVVRFLHEREATVVMAADVGQGTVRMLGKH